MTLTSAAFEAGQKIPKRFTGDGQDISPALAWGDLPEDTQELALICDDPDAPTPQPWVHWIIYGLSPQLDHLPEAVPRKQRMDQPVTATQGVNSWPSDNIGYRGPAPPPGHGTHHYHFKLYALDTPLGLEPRLDKAALLKAMQGHILAETELIGTYSR